MHSFSHEAEQAKLFIPGHKNPEAALKWRYQIIKKEKIFPHDQLFEILKRAAQNSLDQTTKTALVRTAGSEEMLLDEVERAKLFVTTLLLSADKVSPKSVLAIDRNSKILAGGKSMEQFAKDNPDHVERTRRNQLSLGQAYLKRDVSKIRAKVAFQEIVAAIVPNEMVPLMVSISPKYLACPFTQHWIRVHQYHSQHGMGPNQEKARKCLAALSKAIQGDPRTMRKRRYPYWALSHKYEDLSGWLDGFRDHHRKKKLDMDTFEMFFRLRKIPDIYKKLVLHSNRSPKLLALEIFADQGLIDDPKAFKDFQSKISKLKKKHYATEIMLVVEDFLDLPTHSPEMLSRIDHLSVLERVRL